jgi:hypothetical protein
MLDCQAWDVVVLRVTLLLVVGRDGDMELGELQPCPRHLLSITLVKPDAGIPIADQPQLFLSSVCLLSRDLHPTNTYMPINSDFFTRIDMAIEFLTDDSVLFEIDGSSMHESC